MATTTSKLGLTKPSYTDGADVGVLNNNFDILDREVSKRTRVWNLLDNSYFPLAHVVNQRGQSNYVGIVDTVDRWKTLHSTTTVTVDENGLTITGGNAQAWVEQIVPNKNQYIGKTMTMAIGTATGEIIIGSGVVVAEGLCISSYGSGIYLRLETTTTETTMHYCIIVDGGSKTVQWAALYIGTYTADTLPEYQPKGYAAELAECRQYDRQINPNGFLGFVIRNADGYGFQGLVPCEPMRINSPTILGTIAVWDGSDSHAITGITEFSWAGNGFRVVGATATQGTPGAVVALYAVSDVAINADL